MASFKEIITVAAYALRSIVTVNTSGAAGGPLIPLHGLSDDQGNQLGLLGAPLPVADAGVAALLAGPFVTTRAGTTGVDFSANAAVVPAVSANIVLVTIPATPGRAAVEVQNQSAATVQLVRDDGNGGNVTSILLGPGAAAGQQGGAWKSETFKGRVRVYGPAGSQVAAYQD